MHAICTQSARNLNDLFCKNNICPALRAKVLNSQLNPVLDCSFTIADFVVEGHDFEGFTVSAQGLDMCETNDRVNDLAWAYIQDLLRGKGLDPAVTTGLATMRGPLDSPQVPVEPGNELGPDIERLTGDPAQKELKSVVEELCKLRAYFRGWGASPSIFLPEPSSFEQEAASTT